jgi:hypothetical protein
MNSCGSVTSSVVLSCIYIAVLWRLWEYHHAALQQPPSHFPSTTPQQPCAEEPSVPRILIMTTYPHHLYFYLDHPHQKMLQNQVPSIASWMITLVQMGTPPTIGKMTLHGMLFVEKLFVDGNLYHIWQMELWGFINLHNNYVTVILLQFYPLETVHHTAYYTSHCIKQN